MEIDGSRKTQQTKTVMKSQYRENSSCRPPLCVWGRSRSGPRKRTRPFVPFWFLFNIKLLFLISLQFSMFGICINVGRTSLAGVPKRMGVAIPSGKAQVVREIRLLCQERMFKVDFDFDYTILNFIFTFLGVFSLIFPHTFFNIILKFFIIFPKQFLYFKCVFLKIFSHKIFNFIYITLKSCSLSFSNFIRCYGSYHRWSSQYPKNTLPINFGELKFELKFKTEVVLRRKLMKKIETHLEVVHGALGLRYLDGSLITSRFINVNRGTVDVFIRDCVGAGVSPSDRVTYENHVVTCAYSNTRGHSNEKLMAIKIATAQDRDFVANELNLTEIDVVSLANGIGGWAKIVSGHRYAYEKQPGNRFNSRVARERKKNGYGTGVVAKEPGTISAYESLIEDDDPHFEILPLDVKLSENCREGRIVVYRSPSMDDPEEISKFYEIVGRYLKHMRQSGRFDCITYIGDPNKHSSAVARLTEEALLGEYQLVNLIGEMPTRIDNGRETQPDSCYSWFDPSKVSVSAAVEGKIHSKMIIE